MNVGGIIKMSYLGLNLDSLCWELESLIKNNYGKISNMTKEQIGEVFEMAENDILETFKDIINQNKDDVVNDIFKEMEDE